MKILEQAQNILHDKDGKLDPKEEPAKERKVLGGEESAHGSTLVVKLDDLDKLTEVEREILNAVETNNGRSFLILGGATTANLNFTIGIEGIFPLLIASAKGYHEMVKLML